MEFAAICAAHQEECELGASLENPWISDVWRHPALREHLDLDEQGSARAIVKSAGCQYGMSFPGTDVDEEGQPLKGQPIEKGRGWLNNFGLALLEIQCSNGRPGSLC